jgi:hypothetical protein
LSESEELGPDGEFFYYGLYGTMGESNRSFQITLNGNGELCGATSYPQEVDLSSGVSVDEAKQTAIEILKNQAHVINPDNLILVSEELSTEYAPIYILKFEYRAENPTQEEFDYDAEIRVLVATGESCGIGITPITENIDVYTIEEAGQMAIAHIVEQEELEDASKLVITHSQSDSWDGVAMYTFMFDYGDDYCYSLMMTAAGEFWDIAGGPKQ